MHLNTHDFVIDFWVNMTSFRIKNNKRAKEKGYSRNFDSESTMVTVNQRRISHIAQDALQRHSQGIHIRPHAPVTSRGRFRATTGLHHALHDLKSGHHKLEALQCIYQEFMHYNGEFVSKANVCVDGE